MKGVITTRTVDAVLEVWGNKERRSRATKGIKSVHHGYDEPIGCPWA